MLYYFKGKDFKKTLQRARGVADALLLKKPNASLFRMSEENWSEPLFFELLESQGLFEKKYIILADRLFSNFGDFLEDKIKDIKESEHVFLIVEELLPKKLEEKISKQADKMEKVRSTRSGESVEKEFNLFSLTDALANRESKRLWVLLEKAKMNGVVSEEIFPLLFWQVKTLLSVKLSKNPEELGLKPFVLGKAKRAGDKWEEDKLKKLSSDMVSMYHNSRLGLVNFEIELEKMILEM